VKAKLEFDLPEEQSEFMLAANAGKYASVLWDVEQQVFRPARKHGYSGPHSMELNKLCENEDVAEAIHLLEQLYYEIKNSTLMVADE